MFNGYLLAVFAQYRKALLPWKIGIWLLVFFTVGWWFDPLVCVCVINLYIVDIVEPIDDELYFNMLDKTYGSSNNP